MIFKILDRLKPPTEKEKKETQQRQWIQEGKCSSCGRPLKWSRKPTMKFMCVPGLSEPGTPAYTAKCECGNIQWKCVDYTEGNRQQRRAIQRRQN